MKRLTTFIAILALLAAGVTFAANNDNHTVRVSVPTINEVALGEALVTIDFTDNTFDAEAQYTGGDAYVEESSSNTYLYWFTNQTNQKITVQADAADAGVTLYVRIDAINGLVGTAGTNGAGTDTELGTTATDVVTAISGTIAQATMVYTARVTPAAAAANNDRSVTYTITSGS